LVEDGLKVIAIAFNLTNLIT